MSCDENNNLVIYDIRYMSMKSLDPDIDRDNFLRLIVNNVNGYIIEEINESEYLINASTNRNKKVLKKYTKLWNEIKHQIKIT